MPTFMLAFFHYTNDLHNIEEVFLLDFFLNSEANTHEMLGITLSIKLYAYLTLLYWMIFHSNRIRKCEITI